MTSSLAVFLLTYQLAQPTVFASSASQIVTYSWNWLCSHLCSSGEEEEDAEKSQDSPAKEEETQTESS